jgi:carbon monoxide dehydrogenase subunit G
VNLQYSGQEQIPVDPATVWAFVTDPEQVGHCLPDLLELTVQDATHFHAVVRVGVGPVRGSFKFKFELQPDAPARRVNMKIAGGGFGSAIDMTAGADVVAAADAGGTILNWGGSAVMRGPVAAVGGRVLDAQARKLIAQTFGNVRERLMART